MHFGFALELSDIDLWNIDLLDTHLDLLDTDIPSKNFVCLHSVFKASSRYVFKTSSRHVFKMSSGHVFKTSSRHVFKKSSRRLQDMSSRRLQDMPSRRLQDVFSVTIFCLPRRLQDVFCYAEDVLKTFSRHILKTSWRRLQDQQMFTGNIVSKQKVKRNLQIADTFES